MPGDEIETPWSPDCSKCWAESDGCSMHMRELEGQNTTARRTTIGRSSPSLRALRAFLWDAWPWRALPP
eukprot:7382820-Prymnesium_polylepis.1